MSEPRASRHGDTAAHAAVEAEPTDAATAATVLMYATGFCPYCVRARRLLKRKGVAFEEVRVDQDRERHKEMVQRSRRNTVPQIFIGETHVGGYDDMAAMDASGQLDLLLEHGGTVAPAGAAEGHR